MTITPRQGESASPSDPFSDPINRCDVRDRENLVRFRHIPYLISQCLELIEQSPKSGARRQRARTPVMLIFGLNRYSVARTGLFSASELCKICSAIGLNDIPKRQGILWGTPSVVLNIDDLKRGIKAV